VTLRASYLSARRAPHPTAGPFLYVGAPHDAPRRRTTAPGTPCRDYRSFERLMGLHWRVDNHRRRPSLVCALGLRRGPAFTATPFHVANTLAGGVVTPARTPSAATPVTGSRTCLRREQHHSNGNKGNTHDNPLPTGAMLMGIARFVRGETATGTLKPQEATCGANAGARLSPFVARNCTLPACGVGLRMASARVGRASRRWRASPWRSITTARSPT